MTLTFDPMTHFMYYPYTKYENSILNLVELSERIDLFDCTARRQSHVSAEKIETNCLLMPSIVTVFNIHTQPLRTTQCGLNPFFPSYKE